MRKGLSAAVIAILLSSFSVAAPPAASAEESSTPMTGSVPGQLQATVTKEGNKTIVEYQGQSTTVTTDPITGEMVIGSGEDVIKVLPEDIAAMEASFSDKVQGVSFRSGIETDWKKYLCSAAAEAAVSGHGAAWNKALQITEKAIKTGKANPWLIAISAVLHAGAGVFLSAQC